MHEPELESMKAYFREHHYEYKRWEIEKPSEFYEDLVMIMLYQDFYAKSFRELEESLDLGYKVSHNSLLSHNISIVREAIRVWADQQIFVGTLDNWNLARKNVSLPSVVEDTNLWLDSADFCLTSKSSMSRKDDNWSHKEDGPASRYHFIKVAQNSMENTFNGAAIIADNRYEQGSKGFRKVKFYLNHRATRKVGKVKKVNIPEEELPRKVFNEAHRVAKAKVDPPDRDLKKRAECLGKVYWESSEQQQHMIHILSAIHNSVL